MYFTVNIRHWSCLLPFLVGHLEAWLGTSAGISCRMAQLIGWGEGEREKGRREGGRERAGERGLSIKEGRKTSMGLLFFLQIWIGGSWVDVGWPYWLFPIPQMQQIGPDLLLQSSCQSLNPQNQ